MAEAPPRRIALCAPGKRVCAEITLAIHGDEVEEIREHPWLQGDDIWVFEDPEQVAIPFPVTFDKPLAVFPSLPGFSAPLSVITGLT